MLGAQAEGVQAEVLGNPTFSLRPKSLQPEPLQPIYLNRYQVSTGCASVDSKLSCPVLVARDLSGSSSHRFQPCAEMISRTVPLGSTIGRALD